MMSINRQEFDFPTSIKWLNKWLNHITGVGDGFLDKPNFVMDIINFDINRTMIHSGTNAYDFFDGWQRKQNFAYTQGDMIGGMYAPIMLVFSKGFVDAQATMCFGYIDDKKKRSGLRLQFLTDDPKSWILTILKNADNDDLTKREVTIFYSEDFSKPTEDFKSNKLGWAEVEAEVLKTIESQSVINDFKEFMSSDGAINVNKIEEIKKHLDTGKGAAYLCRHLVDFCMAADFPGMIKALDEFRLDTGHKNINQKKLDAQLNMRHDFIVNRHPELMEALIKKTSELDAYLAARIDKADPIVKQQIFLCSGIHDRFLTDKKLAFKKRMKPVVAGVVGIAGIGALFGFFMGLVLSPVTFGISVIIMSVIGAFVGAVLGALTLYEPASMLTSIHRLVSEPVKDALAVEEIPQDHTKKMDGPSSGRKLFNHFGHSPEKKVEVIEERKEAARDLETSSVLKSASAPVRLKQ